MYTVHNVHSFLMYHVSHLCLPTVIQLLVGQAQCTNYCTVDSAHNYARCVQLVEGSGYVRLHGPYMYTGYVMQQYRTHKWMRHKYFIATP